MHTAAICEPVELDREADLDFFNVSGQTAVARRGAELFEETLDNHHIVEKHLLRRLKPEEWGDKNLYSPSDLDGLVPGYLIRMKEHQGTGGLAARLRSEIPETMNKDQIIAEIKFIYEDEGLNDLWSVTRSWLRNNGFPNTPE